MGRAISRAAWAALLWTHVAFPLLLLVRARVRPRPIASAPVCPSVSVIIAAYNAEGHIAERLENIAAQDYPRERVEVIVASDGSADETVAIARRAPGVRVLELPRVGKADALNAAVAASGGEILVFTDANTRFDADAVRALVAPFADPSVGGVAGDQRYVAGAGAAGERSHWALDRVLKVAESRGGSTISATGAIYALRRELFQEIPAGVTDDFFVSTGVVDHGRRLVFAPEARAWEEAASSERGEYRRKVRIISQGFLALWHRRALLDPRRSGFYAVQLLTHKLMRRLSVVPLLLIGLATPGLARRSTGYRILLGLEAAIVGLAAVGVLGPRRFARSRVVSIPTFFCVTNVAVLHALVNVLRGRRIDRWSPTHEPPDRAKEAGR